MALSFTERWLFYVLSFLILNKLIEIKMLLPENGFDQLACILQKPVVMFELNFMHAFLP
jgi:hypothetical protein